MILVIGAAIAVALGVYQYVRESRRFALKDIELGGAQHMKREQILAIADLKLGTNLFRVDTQAVRQRLLAEPWFADVQVVRLLPGTLHIEVEEREAVAVASIGEGLYLISANGEPFKAMGAGDPADLPVITGVTPENLAHDKKREFERLRIGLEVLREYQRLGLNQSLTVQEVHLSTAGDVALVAGKSGVTFELGKGPWQKKLLMAADVMRRLGTGAKAPKVVFLDNLAHPERVVVRMH